jgi:hypothetical protein
MSSEYRIKALSDFLTIPAEKMGEALRDFAIWLDMRRDRSELEGLISDLIGVADSVKFGDEFIWVDDGVTGLSQIDLVATGGELIASIKRPEAA